MFGFNFWKKKVDPNDPDRYMLPLEQRLDKIDYIRLKNILNQCEEVRNQLLAEIDSKFEENIDSNLKMLICLAFLNKTFLRLYLGDNDYNYLEYIIKYRYNEDGRNIIDMLCKEYQAYYKKYRTNDDKKKYIKDKKKTICGLRDLLFMIFSNNPLVNLANSEFEEKYDTCKTFNKINQTHVVLTDAVISQYIISFVENINSSYLHKTNELILQYLYYIAYDSLRQAFGVKCKVVRINLADNKITEKKYINEYSSTSDSVLIPDIYDITNNEDRIISSYNYLINKKDILKEQRIVLLKSINDLIKYYDDNLQNEDIEKIINFIINNLEKLKNKVEYLNINSETKSISMLLLDLDHFLSRNSNNIYSINEYEPTLQNIERNEKELEELNKKKKYEDALRLSKIIENNKRKLGYIASLSDKYIISIEHTEKTYKTINNILQKILKEFNNLQEVYTILKDMKHENKINDKIEISILTEPVLPDFTLYPTLSEEEKTDIIDKLKKDTDKKNNESKNQRKSRKHVYRLQQITEAKQKTTKTNGGKRRKTKTKKNKLTNK